jgi:hypothetical protein
MTGRLVTFAGVLLALSFIALSAAINWRYGHSVGRDAADQFIFAAISLAGDIAKAITPFFFWYALAGRRVLPAIAAALFWISCTAYSLSSAAGFAELNRAEQTGRLVTGKETYEALQGEIARKEGQLKALGSFDPPGVIAQRLEALRQNPRWASSRQCTDATASASRSFCAAYHTQASEREKAIEGEKLEAEIADLRAKLPALAGAARIAHGDPRAGFLVRLTGWDILKVQTGFALLFIAVLEIGSGLGLFIALSHGGQARPGEAPSPAPAPAPFGDVAKFARARLAAAEGEGVSFDDLHAAYTAWCAEHGHKPLARPDFDRRFLILCEAVGFACEEQGGERVCRDLKLVP